MKLVIKFLIVSKYYQKVQDEQLELQVLADVAIKVYAMTACLSRCNKSLLLCLRNCDYERFMCKSFISKTYRECYSLLDRLTRKLLYKSMFFKKLNL